jgi:hypothetical protein
MESFSEYVKNLAAVKIHIPNAPNVKIVVDMYEQKRFKRALSALIPGIQAASAYPESLKFKATALSAIKTFTHYLKQNLLDSTFILANPFEGRLEFHSALDAIIRSVMLDTDPVKMAFRISVIINAALHAEASAV